MVETDGANFEAADVLRVFPTFVWKAQVAPGVRRRIEDDVVAKLDGMRRDAGEPAPGRGWQSEKDLHHLDEFRRLVACIHDAAESVLEFLKIGDGAFEITGLWANMNPKGVAHPIHNHPNNFLSGVYYVRTHEAADTVNFHDPRSQTGSSGRRSRNSPQRTRIRWWSRSTTAAFSCSRPGCPIRSTSAAATRRGSASVSTSCSLPLRKQ